MAVVNIKPMETAKMTEIEKNRNQSRRTYSFRRGTRRKSLDQPIKTKTFYWDTEQTSPERPKEMLKVMTNTRARSLLGVGMSGESDESLTWESIYKAFRQECNKLEVGIEDENGTTLRDCHEAYQILIKHARPKIIREKDKEEMNALLSYQINQAVFKS